MEHFAAFSLQMGNAFGAERGSLSGGEQNMKRALLCFVVFVVIITGVLALTNVLQSTSMNSDSTIELVDGVWGLSLGSGFKQIERDMNLKSATYGGTIVIEIEKEVAQFSEESVKASYQKLGTVDFPYTDEVMDEVKELFGLEQTKVTSIYHKKDKLTREMYAFTTPDHGDYWVVYAKVDGKEVIFFGYSEDECDLPGDQPVEESAEK